MKLEEAIKRALDATRKYLSEAEGDELEVYEEFSEYFGSEIYGWEMRIEELCKERVDE